jgi:hypothetical protein
VFGKESRDKEYLSREWQTANTLAKSKNARVEKNKSDAKYLKKTKRKLEGGCKERKMERGERRRRRKKFKAW